ncbi:MAG: MATE family efflux transporter [Pirellulales bacterium]|nr:MATE family efflux transporter [Pirellulales bacterium]
MTLAANRPLTEMPGTLRPMLSLALPVLAEQMLNALVGLTDRFLTGHFLEGKAYLAAINQSAYVLWLFTCLFATVSIGATALVARFVGGGDWTLARRAVHQSLMLGAMFVLAIVGVAVVIGHELILMTGLEADAVEFTERYLAIILIAMPAIMVEQVGIACLRGSGDTISGLMAMIAMNGVNMALSSALCIGVGPIPKFGWEGLAIGTATGYYAGAAIVLVRMARNRRGIGLDWRLLRPDSDLLRRLLRVGLPGGADFAAIVACHLWYLRIINRVGDMAAAAHGITNTAESFSYLPGVAFQVAASTLAGQFLGARDPQRAGRSVSMACRVGGGVMTVMGGAFLLLSEPITAFFVNDQQRDIAVLAASALRIAAIGQPFLALTMVLSGALRGAGDTRWPLLFTFVGFICVRIPLAYWLAWPEVPLGHTGIVIAGWNLGLLGAWTAAVADIIVRCCLVSFRFYHGGWKQVRV